MALQVIRVPHMKLEIGKLINNDSPLPLSREGRVRVSGFTLIEILVVLVIVAIIMAVAVMSLGHMGRGRHERMVVQQFTRVITEAQQQAILTPEVLGLSFHSGGYQFYEYQPPTKLHSASWQSLRDDVLSNVSAFRNLLTAQLTTVSGYTAKIKTQAASPIIIFSPSGSVTPFILNLQGDNRIYSVSVENNGNAIVTERAAKE